jgi:hypothetical protein
MQKMSKFQYVPVIVTLILHGLFFSFAAIFAALSGDAVSTRMSYVNALMVGYLILFGLFTVLSVYSSRKLSLQAFSRTSTVGTAVTLLLASVLPAIVCCALFTGAAIAWLSTMVAISAILGR